MLPSQFQGGICNATVPGLPSNAAIALFVSQPWSLAQDVKECRIDVDQTLVIELGHSEHAIGNHHGDAKAFDDGAGCEST